MIIRISLVICAFLLSPSMGKMNLGTFSRKFEESCFQNNPDEPFRVFGQDKPISNTMESFISMAEKFEVANPGVDLRDELIFFISEFLFENIKITNGKVDERHERANFKNIDTLWDSPAPFQLNNPFTSQEMCALYFMISHSILDQDTMMARAYGVPYGNFSTNVQYNIELNPSDYYPQEIGVVQVRGVEGAVSLSRILLGILVGKENRKTDLKSFTLNFDVIKETKYLDQIVDALYIVTMGEVLMMSSWEGSERQGMAENGEWVSIPLSNGDKTEGFCPMVNKQHLTNGQKTLPAYSYSSVRGAADGLILGLTVRQISRADIRLSQLLRMYYSPKGIVVENNIDDINDKRVSFCSRDILIKALEPKVEEQMTLYGYLVAINENDVPSSFGRSKPLYDKNRGNIFTNRGTNGFCSPPNSLDKPEDLPAETFLDIIVVMDSSNTEKNFIDQQQIIGYIAKELDLRNSGSQMTILLDRKDETPRAPSRTTTSRIELLPVVNETFSSTCAACSIIQIPEVYRDSKFVQSTFSREDVIVAVDQLLHERKLAETGKSGVNGKVVILFNYENAEGRAYSDRVQGNVDKALRDLNLRHQDVLLYAVGLNQDVLMKYARNDNKLVFLGTEDRPKEVADKILKEIFYVSALLQYNDCQEARNEKSALYESFVSPNKIQHYTMPAAYFYKTFHAKITFESQNGLVRVCYNRVPKPEGEIKFCKDTTATTGVEFRIDNPCQSFTKESCSPLYFAVMGIDPASETNGNQVQKQISACKTNDRTCSSMDQIKFRVSHEGIRCSGCLGLGAPPAVIILSLVLAYILCKRF